MKEKNIETIGGRLKALRESKKMSQEQLATKLHFANKGMISAYETEKRDVSIGALKAYSEYFCVSIDWLLTGIVKNEKVLEKYGKYENIISIILSIQSDTILDVASKQLSALKELE